MNGITNKIGPCVENEDFYGRSKELEDAWQLIEDGHSLILAAPRRVGKTSFAKRINSNARKEGWICLYINLEGVRDIIEFLEKIIQELQQVQKLPDKILRIAKSVFKGLKVSGKYKDIEAGVEWNMKSIPAVLELQRLMQSLEKEKIVIVCDELTVLLKKIVESGDFGLQNAEHFLDLLRSLRMTTGCQHRWIFCSSISLESFLEENTLSKCMNDVKRFKLDEFNEEEAHGLIVGLSTKNGYEFNLAEREYLFHKIGLRLPYYIQLMYSEIYNIKGRYNLEPVSMDDIDKAYASLTRHQAYFNTWSERLKDYSDEKYLRKVLRKIAESKNGCSRNILVGLFADKEFADEIVARLITILVNDGYIILSSNKKYVFRSFLLKDYWYYKFIA